MGKLSVKQFRDYAVITVDGKTINYQLLEGKLRDELVRYMMIGNKVLFEGMWFYHLIDLEGGRAEKFKTFYGKDTEKGRRYFLLGKGSGVCLSEDGAVVSRYVKEEWEDVSEKSEAWKTVSRTWNIEVEGKKRKVDSMRGNFSYYKKEGSLFFSLDKYHEGLYFLDTGEPIMHAWKRDWLIPEFRYEHKTESWKPAWVYDLKFDRVYPRDKMNQSLRMVRVRSNFYTIDLEERYAKGLTTWSLFNKLIVFPDGREEKLFKRDLNEEEYYRLQARVHVNEVDGVGLGVFMSLYFFDKDKGVPIKERVDELAKLLNPAAGIKAYVIERLLKEGGVEYYVSLDRKNWERVEEVRPNYKRMLKKVAQEIENSWSLVEGSPKYIPIPE